MSEEGNILTGKIENILSIDFDIIMFPCIKLYNEKIGGDLNPTNLWLQLEREYEIDKYLSYDSKVYRNICKLIKHHVSKGSKLISLINHEDIVTELKKDNDYETNLFNIINIDYHHDIHYSKESIIETKYFDKTNCSNWLGYLIDNNKIADKLVWLCAPNSEPCRDEKYVNKFTAIENITNGINKEYLDMNFNKIYLVRSPQWVPYKYIHLYDLIIDLFGEKEEEV